MPLQITPNPRPTGNLSITANQAARMSSVLSIDWGHITNVPAGISAIGSVTGTGLLAVINAGGAGALRTITGTANEITLTNGDGVAGNPVVSLPTALTFTGKTITGGTYTSVVSINGNFWTAGTGTLTIAASKTLTASNTLTLAGSDGTTMTFPTTSATLARTDAGNTFTGHQTIEGVTSTGATGTGNFVFDGTPTLVTPVLGVATATSINKVAFTAPATAATLTILNNKTATFNNSITFAGTDATTMTFPSTTATIARTDAANTFTGHQTIEGVTSTGATGTGKFVFDGTPTLVTPVLGTPTSGTLTNCTGLPLSGLANQAAWTFLFNNTSGSAAPTANTIDGLTVKASPAAGDEVMIWDVAGTAIKKATVSSIASAGSVSSIAGNTGAFTLTAPITNATNAIVLNATITPQGRLTLVTATPIMGTTQSAKTTIFYTPYQGNLIPIYDGTNMIPTAFTELSVVTTDATKSPAAIGASKVNDWFVWNDAGTIRIGHGPDWTNDTGRSAGTALTLVNGIYLNNASLTNGPAASRGTYVGTTRSNGSSQLDWIIGGSAAGGTGAFLYLWNAYNRRAFVPVSQDSTASWNYTTAAWRSADNSTANRISFVRGLDEDSLVAHYCGLAVSTSTNAVQLGLGIGLDSTSALATGASGYSSSATTFFNAVSNDQIASVAHYGGMPGFGVHFLQALEWGGTTGAFAGISGPTSGGLFATVFC